MKKLFVISAPSGAGKTSLVQALLDKYANDYALSRVVTYTTRAPRLNERDGIDYHFISKDRFKNRIKENFFIEITEYNQSLYGTARKSLEVKNSTHHKIAILDRNGASTLKEEYPKAVLIWIYPPSINELQKRLLLRKSENTNEINKRIAIAQQEIQKEKNQPIYNHHIKNDFFDVALKELVTIIKKHINS